MTNERRLLYFFLICMLLIFGFQAVMLVVMVFSPSNASQPAGPSDLQEWPLPLQDLRTAMAAEGLDVAAMEVYKLASLPDEKAIARMPNSDAALEFLTRRLELTPAVSLPPGIDRELELLPENWEPGDRTQLQPLESRGIREGNEGDLYYLFLSTDGEQIFISYYFDF